MLFAHTKTALGGVSEQILQGKRLLFYHIQFQKKNSGITKKFMNFYICLSVFRKNIMIINKLALFYCIAYYLL